MAFIPLCHEKIETMFTLFISSAVALTIFAMLSFFKKEHFDPDDWADRKEYQKFWREIESWKNPVRWA
ncbi:hypothetical protein U14_00206 [Candidatus Moduliflexus flocculans]|uniref:Uncharacterized protein n=1 Tax=Candidatus Moduliflexus flocculans TaxID=1499966 RepID=A0A0S6VPG9_9BACT|nr:hypothetical protein U14_00206 [Candidatus Moduliflexus flocculans]